MKTSLKEAMKAKDAVRLGVVKGLLAAFTNEAVALSKSPSDLLEDDEAMKVIKRAAKQRKDSIAQFEAGGRPELAVSEKEELAIIEEYLPTEISDEEIEKIVMAKKEEMGVSDKSQIGQFMGAVMKEVGDRADGSRVKAAVDKALG